MLYYHAGEEGRILQLTSVAKEVELGAAEDRGENADIFWNEAMMIVEVTVRDAGGRGIAVIME